MNSFPEINDFVAVIADHVEYYGYISDIDYDLRNLMVKVEFYPGYWEWFEMHEIKLMNYPSEK